MATSLAKQLNDITECSICSDQFTDPRSLPCVHTFCSKCIQRSGDGKEPGESLPCPLCRKEFTVPAGGMVGLPKNFFVEKMLNMKRLTTAQSSPSKCEACDTDDMDEPENELATAYCVDCQEKLCEDCARYHRKCKTARTHRIVKLDESGRLRNEEILSKSVPSVCERHEDQTLAIFCRDCKMAICVVCYIGTHKQHDCSDIKDVVTKFQEQMTADAISLAEGIGTLQDWLTTLAERKEGFSKRVLETKEEILKKADELQKLIERNKNALLNELEIGRDQVVKQVDHLIQDITQQISLMENLKKYTEELCSKGTDGDIAYGTSALRDRTDEMLNLDSIKKTRDDLNHIDVQFTASTLIKEDSGNVVGQLDVHDFQQCAPKLSHTLPSTGYSVAGVTSLANQLFVVRRAPQHVEVYDATTFALQRNIAVSGLQNAYGLASCIVNNCLYASNYNPQGAYNQYYGYTIISNVYRIDLGNEYVSNWNVGQHPTGLFVNKANNVMICSQQDRHLYEYTTHGSLIRSINLQALSPWYAIQIEDDQFIVSHTGGMSVVNASGQVLRSYDGTVAGSVQLSNPAGLVRVRSGCILVANRDYHKLTLLNPTLSSARDFQLPANIGLQRPYSVWLDESRGRLYVGEDDGSSRVHVIDGVFNVGKRPF